MTLWFVLALMTAAAMFAVLWPLGRRAPVSSGSDVAVYRDQLDEIERDRAAGLIADNDAEAARIEVSRRLLAAADAAQAAPVTDEPAAWRRRAAAVAALILLPAGAAGIYLILGSPQIPSEPHSARLQSPLQNQSIQSLVGQVEAHIGRNPQDGRGWEVLAPVYLRLGRYDDAVKARRKALELNGATAQRESDLAEALVAAANGIVTAEAKTAFERALKLDAKDAKSRFYIGLAAEQDGRRDEAASTWRAMLENAPPDASWAAIVREALARITSPEAPGPSAADVAAAANIQPEQRKEMVRGMVAGLAARLAQDGSDIDGWLRLVRAYIVLGERDKAHAAVADARRVLARDPEKLRRIDGLVKELGLES
jgi:cytochrome c-type biogenesis protein CcmH